MYIHWFPGHMTRAYRIMEKSISLVDSVVYVLDARAPLSCINLKFDSLIKNKPVLYVLNKADLIPADLAIKWEKYFKDTNNDCISLNSINPNSSSVIKNELQKIHFNLVSRYSNKDVRRTPRTIVIGVPNSGKSTLINNFIGKKKAETANKPGVTRGIQWVRVDENIDLMDSPGVLYPDFTDQSKAFKLASIGSIREERFDSYELATLLFFELAKRNRKELASRFNDDDLFASKDPIEIIARIRGYLLKGGELDTERAASAFINEFRKGLLGKVCLDDIPQTNTKTQ